MFTSERTIPCLFLIVLLVHAQSGQAEEPRFLFSMGDKRRDAFIDYMKFSGNGAMLASIDSKGEAVVWDAASGNRLLTLDQGQKVEPDQGQTVDLKVCCGIAFSSDSRTVSAYFTNKEVDRWDLATKRKTIVSPGEQKSDSCVDCTPDGQSLICMTEDEVDLWDVGSRRNLVLSRGPKVYSYHPRLTFSRDGSLLAFPRGDDWGGEKQNAEVVLWNLATKMAGPTLRAHRMCINCLGFSPDGQTLATGSEDETAVLWDIRTGKEVAIFQEHTGPVRALAFSPDGAILATGSKDRSVMLWDIAKKKEKMTLRGFPEYGVDGLAFSPDGTILASWNWSCALAGNRVGEIRLWDSATGRTLSVLQRHTPRKLAFSPDGRVLASGGQDGVIKLWDLPVSKKAAMDRQAQPLFGTLARQ